MDEGKIVRQYGKLKNLRVVGSINRTSANAVREILMRHGIKLTTKVECKLVINPGNDLNRTKTVIPKV